MNELVLIVEDEEHIAQLLRFNLQKQDTAPSKSWTGTGAPAVGSIGPTRAARPHAARNGRLGGLPHPARERAGCGHASHYADRSRRRGARIRGLQTGADDFITKPFSVRELLLKVRKLIDKSTALKATSGRARVRDQLSYLVHELKNSVSVIKGYATLADDRGDARRYLGRITMTSKHMEQILDDASLLVRLESGDRPWPLEPSRSSTWSRIPWSPCGRKPTPRVGLHVSGGAGCRIMGERRAVQQIVTNSSRTR